MMQNYIACLMIQPLLVLTLVIHGYRLKTYLSGKISALRGFEASALSAFFSLLMPARSNELVKPIYLSLKEGVAFPEATGAVLLERVFDLIFFILTVSLVLLLAGFEEERGSLLFFAIMLLVLLSAIVCYIFYGQHLIALLERFKFKRLADLMASGHEGVATAWKNSFKWYMLLMGALVWFFLFMTYYVFFSMGFWWTASNSYRECPLPCGDLGDVHRHHARFVGNF